jgi:hypothetical protein
MRVLIIQDLLVSAQVLGLEASLTGAQSIVEQAAAPVEAASSRRWHFVSSPFRVRVRASAH